MDNNGKNMVRHLQLIDDAREAIDKVYNDTTVSTRDTKISLEELIEDIEIKMNKLNS